MENNLNFKENLNGRFLQYIYILVYKGLCSARFMQNGSMLYLTTKPTSTSDDAFECLKDGKNLTAALYSL